MASPIPPDKLSGTTQYEISHILMRTETRQEGRRTLYPVEGRLVRVEEYASHLLATAGWSVFKGDDAHFFFSILSCNFKESPFRDTLRSWAGGCAEERISRLDVAVNRSISSGTVLPGLIDEAEGMLRMYYASYPPKQAVYTAIAEQARCMDKSLLLRLIKFYRRIGYTVKGAPDLFAAADGAFWFVEVKSYTDSLRPEQYDFFEGYLTSVGKNILVLRVVANDTGTP